jgi:hypothetical protein
MLRRMLAAYGKRIGQEPVEGLAHLRELEAALTDATNLGIHAALEAGQSPTALAGVLGVSRQAIYKRAALGGRVADQGRQPRVDALRAARPRELPPGK